MKYADILFLIGRFKESLELVQKLEINHKLGIGDQIELLRIKGHIYRFQQECKSAEIIYRSALEMAQPFMIAKIFYLPIRLFLIAVKLSSLRSCSTRHASSKAVSLLTPMLISQSERIV